MRLLPFLTPIGSTVTSIPGRSLDTACRAARWTARFRQVDSNHFGLRGVQVAQKRNEVLQLCPQGMEQDDRRAAAEWRPPGRARSQAVTQAWLCSHRARARSGVATLLGSRSREPS